MVPASAKEVFSFLDDHSRLSSHMSKPSWKMGGGSMEIKTDDQQGKSIGSHLILHGVVFGMPIYVDEQVIQYRPPERKVWQTVGEPKLLVIGSYQMGVELEDHGQSTQLSVFIDYALPNKQPWHCLGRVFSGYYAKWCASQMANDTAQFFLRKNALNVAS
jgi:hypothetical protein